MTLKVISEADTQFFHNNGYLVIRNALHPEELKRLRTAINALTTYGSTAVRDHADFMYGVGHKTKAKVLRRIEFIIDKCDECKVLLGHPLILHSVEKLMGKDFIPTWDSMVLKMPGEGIAVPWHRDAGDEMVGDAPIFNVDFYIDEADLDTCLWVIPASHKWSNAEARAELIKRKGGFSTEDTIPVPMQPGDVLFHNILLLHSSPANSSNKLRRVVYYEFRTTHVEEEKGPHVPAYIPLKQEVLLACINKRKVADYIPADEQPYIYDPPAPWSVVKLSPGTESKSYRYVHKDYWRT